MDALKQPDSSPLPSDFCQPSVVRSDLASCSLQSSGSVRLQSDESREGERKRRREGEKRQLVSLLSLLHGSS